MAELPITVFQGRTYRRRFTFDSIDITGWTFLAQIRAGTADGTPVEAEFTCTIIDGPTGVMEAVLDPADTEPLDPSFTHMWDLEATTGTGDQYPVIHPSQVTVIAEVSRPAP